jgi:hypothetical protein
MAIRQKQNRNEKTLATPHHFLLVFWLHSVFGQNHLYVRMLQTGIPLFKVKSKEFQSSLSAVRTTCLSVRTSDRQASFVRTTCFFRLDTYIVSRSFCASLLRPDISAACPDAYQFSNGSLILSKFKKGKINQPSGQCGIISVRQESQFKMNRPDI